jgi:hypothetical protein
MKLIPLTQGKFAIVDDEDFEMLSKFKWSATLYGKTFYAMRTAHRMKMNIFLHQMIITAPDGMEIDHINRNGLDNRRRNLRICTRSQNLANQGLHSNNTSGLKGVSWCRQTRKWKAQISINHKHKNLGRFEDPEEAHAAYIKAAKKYFGEFARSE